MMPPSRSYAAEPDPEAPGRAIVVRVSSDPAENGIVAGRTAGPRAMTNAITAARLGYTPDDSCDFREETP
jgi:hypothetical protein